MAENNTKHKENTYRINKHWTILFYILTFFGIGLLFIIIKILVNPEMRFSDNLLIRFAGLIICFIIANKVYKYLTGRQQKN